MKGRRGDDADRAGASSTPTGPPDGWNSLTGPEEFGGQGLPTSLSAAVFEMWNSASMGFAIGPTLTVGAIDALQAHGSDEQKATDLPKMFTGERLRSRRT